MSAITMQQPMPVITYHEQKTGKTLYRVTIEYKGKIDFAKTVEDLIVRKILRDELEPGSARAYSRQAL